MTWQKTTSLVAVVGLVVVTALTINHYRQRMHAKETADRIRVLSEILLAERPPAVGAETLAAVTAKYRRPDVLTDAWGRPLVVSMEGKRYVVISRARDGEASPCCVGPDRASPDTDLIAVDGQWRQIWN